MGHARGRRAGRAGAGVESALGLRSRRVPTQLHRVHDRRGPDADPEPPGLPHRRRSAWSAPADGDGLGRRAGRAPGRWCAGLGGGLDPAAQGAQDQHTAVQGPLCRRARSAAARSGGRPGSLCGGRRAALGPPDRRRALPAAGAGTGRDLVQFLHAVRAAGRHLADRRGARPSGAAVGQPARWTAHRGTALPAARHVHPHALVGRQLARRRHRLAARTGRGQRARLRRVAGAATRDAPPRGTAKT